MCDMRYHRSATAGRAIDTLERVEDPSSLTLSSVSLIRDSLAMVRA